MAESTALFLNTWFWLIFVGVGLLLVMLELLLGLDTGLDLAFIGSTFVLGGLVTWPFHIWGITVIVTSVICVAYVVIGRRYVHKWTLVKTEKTNIDAIIGKTGLVTQRVARNRDGRARVGNERWKIRAEEEIEVGDEIVVTGVKGITLLVNKVKGGK